MDELKPEHPANVGLVHPGCAPKPDAKYASISPSEFVGRYVKTAFEGTDPHGVTRQEHLWVIVTKANEGNSVHGTIENDPVLDGVPRYGAPVDVSLDNISQVMPEFK